MNTPVTIELCINASTFTKLACPQAYAYLVREGLKPREENGIFTFGKAIHYFAERYTYHEHSATTLHYNALNTPLLHACYDTTQRYQSFLSRPDEQALFTASIAPRTKLTLPPIHKLTNGSLATEVFFQIPVGEVNTTYKNTPTTFKVYFTGTIDYLSFNPTTNHITIIDYKSTRNTYLKKVQETYSNSPQLQFYMTAIALSPESFNLPPSNTTLTSRICAVICDPLKAKWELLGVEEYRTEFAAGLPNLVQAAVHAYTADDRPDIYTMMGKYYQLCRYCDYTSLCNTSDPSVREAIKGASFIQEPYDPRHRDGTEIASK